MTDPTQAPHIFSSARRAAARDRMVRSANADALFLHRRMSEDILDRLADVTRDFRDALLVGCADAELVAALRARGLTLTCVDPAALPAIRVGGVQAQEDVLPFEEDSFDLIVAAGTLDSVNDLPGALIVMRRLLRPDGMLIGAFFGAGSLGKLRRILIAADDDRPAQRIHPLVDVRAMGDLLSRAGLALPVADADILTVRYASLFALLADLRAMGAGNMLASPPPPLTRASLMRATELFAQASDADGKLSENFTLIHFAGWKPDPSQPKPARRGSAAVSLADALRRKD